MFSPPSLQAREPLHATYPPRILCTNRHNTDTPRHTHTQANTTTARIVHGIQFDSHVLLDSEHTLAHTTHARPPRSAAKRYIAMHFRARTPVQLLFVCIYYVYAAHDDACAPRSLSNSEKLSCCIRSAYASASASARASVFPSLHKTTGSLPHAPQPFRRPLELQLLQHTHTHTPFAGMAISKCTRRAVRTASIAIHSVAHVHPAAAVAINANRNGPGERTERRHKTLVRVCAARFQNGANTNRHSLRSLERGHRTKLRVHVGAQIVRFASGSRLLER